MKKYGQWQIDVSGPYPCWVEISHEGGGKIHGIHHKELRDLEYGLQRALVEIAERLGKDKQEVAREI